LFFAACPGCTQGTEWRYCRPSVQDPPASKLGVAFPMSSRLWQEWVNLDQIELAKASAIRSPEPLSLTCPRTATDSHKLQNPLIRVCRSFSCPPTILRLSTHNDVETRCCEVPRGEGFVDKPPPMGGTGSLLVRVSRSLAVRCLLRLPSIDFAHYMAVSFLFEEPAISGFSERSALYVCRGSGRDVRRLRLCLLKH